MAIRNQKQLQVAQERSNSQAIGRMAKGYRRDIAPLLTAMENAKSPEGLLRAMGPGLLKKMGTEATTEALGVESLKAAAAGVASGTPKDQRPEAEAN